MTKPLAAADPDRLSSYTLLGRLGSGGMGTVYLGRAPAGQLVAIKAIRADLSDDAELRGRFRSEVNRARQVPPSSTAAVLDADLDHQPPYLVVEYVDGRNLEDTVRDNGPLSPESVHSVAAGIATALIAIHGAGVIHRDLKPANVLLAAGGIKVIDFGIARPLELTSQHTRTDQMVGTVAYMAPERFGDDAGRTVAPASDIFAWGVVVAYAATGRTPYAADSAPATAMRILSGRPDLTGLSGRLRDLVRWSLDPDPNRRPTAQSLLDALRTLAPTLPKPPTPPGPAVPPWPTPGDASTPVGSLAAGAYSTAGNSESRPYPPPYAGPPYLAQPVEPMGGPVPARPGPFPPRGPGASWQPPMVPGYPAPASSSPGVRSRKSRRPIAVLAVLVVLAVAGLLAVRRQAHVDAATHAARPTAAEPPQASPAGTSKTSGTSQASGTEADGTTKTGGTSEA